MYRILKIGLAPRHSDCVKSILLILLILSEFAPSRCLRVLRGQKKNWMQLPVLSDSRMDHITVVPLVDFVRVELPLLEKCVNEWRDRGATDDGKDNEQQNNDENRQQPPLLGMREKRKELLDQSGALRLRFGDKLVLRLLGFGHN